MLEINSIKEPFNKVLSYSQGFEMKATDELLKDWAQAKQMLYHMLGEQLIKDCGEVTYTLSDEEKKKLFGKFLKEIEKELPFTTFLEIQKFLETVGLDDFYENHLNTSYFTVSGTEIPKGMKISKALKFFILDKDQLDTVQTCASMYMQKNKVTGHLCISIHPLDFLSSSENTYNWRSCHALDGEYRTGNISYMLDESTVICYIKGEKDAILPRFPSDVPWNNKKWRMLLFVSENKDIIMAGRQYPFSLGEPILNKIKQEFLDFNAIVKFDPWTDELIEKVTLKNGRKIEFYDDNKFFILGSNLRKKKDVIKDNNKEAPSMHFNDLLYSSYYTPYYTFNFWKLREDSKIFVGHDVKCPCCGKNYVEESELMSCFKCASKNEKFPLVTCCICGDRIPEEEALWCDDEDDYICGACFDQNYAQCYRCGEIHRTDIMFWNENLEEYLCECCYNLGEDD